VHRAKTQRRKEVQNQDVGALLCAKPGDPGAECFLSCPAKPGKIMLFFAPLRLGAMHGFWFSL